MDWYSPFSPGVLPYLKRNNIKVYDAIGYDKTTFESMKNTYKYRIMYFDEKTFLNSLDKNKTNYLITQNYIFSQGDFKNLVKFDGKDFYFLKNETKMFFELVAYNPKMTFAIFKINYEK